jgi:hypothetical protein
LHPWHTKLILQHLLTSRYLVTIQPLNPQSSGELSGTLSETSTELTSCGPDTDRRLQGFHSAVHVCLFPDTIYEFGATLWFFCSLPRDVFNNLLSSNGLFRVVMGAPPSGWSYSGFQASYLMSTIVFHLWDLPNWQL